MVNSTAQSYSRPRPGALVISLDFELHWGVRDHTRLDREERARLLSARLAVSEILALFDEYSIRATWAVVGFLFARSREEMEHFSPALKPSYRDSRFDPYREQVGRDEAEDPFHFAPSLIAQIGAQHGQEIGTHSFSHYYSMEPGQGAAEFDADLASASAIAAHSGYSLRSYVFPRNQVHPAYLRSMELRGIRSYRGTQASASCASASFRAQRTPFKRLRRLGDAYFDFEGAQTVAWPDESALVSVGASRYLRPHNRALRGFEDLQYRRVAKAMNTAAERAELFHLWWHPEDFAGRRSENLRFLRRVLGCYRECRERHGMLSLSMDGVAELAVSRQGALLHG